MYLKANGGEEQAVCEREKCDLFVASGLAGSHRGYVNAVNFVAWISLPAPKPPDAKIELVQFIKRWGCFEYEDGTIELESAMDKWRLDVGMPWELGEDRSHSNIRYLEDSPGITVFGEEYKRLVWGRWFCNFRVLVLYYPNDKDSFPSIPDLESETLQLMNPSINGLPFGFTR